MYSTFNYTYTCMSIACTWGEIIYLIEMKKDSQYLYYDMQLHRGKNLLYDNEHVILQVRLLMRMAAVS